jgi:hypothetical protein
VTIVDAGTRENPAVAFGLAAARLDVEMLCPRPPRRCGPSGWPCGGPLCRQAGRPRDPKVYAEAERRFTRQELADLVWLVSVTNAANRLDTAARPGP